MHYVHGTIGIGEHGWGLEEEPPARPARFAAVTSRNNCGAPFSDASSFRISTASRRRALDKGPTSVPCPLRVADGQDRGPLGEPGDKALREVLLDIKARRRDANLTAVTELCRDAPLYSGLELCVREDEDWGMAAKLHGDWHGSICGEAEDCFPNRQRTGERDFADDG